MFDDTFRAKQRLNFEYYKLIHRSILILILVIAPLVLFVGGVYTSSDYEFSDNVRGTAGYGTAILALVMIVWRLIRKNKVRKDLWVGFANATNSIINESSRIVYAGPVVKTGAKYSHSSLVISGKVNNLPFHISKVTTHFSHGTPLISADKQLEYSFKYLVLEIDIGVNLPHIFIDSLGQNSTKFRKTNMWSLPRRLSKNDRIIDLEGDFYKYFDIYIAGIDHKEVAALSIVTPDVMLALRDEGYGFDYEIYQGKLYVISEDTFETVEHLEAYLKSAEAVIEELVPQLQAQLHGDDSNSLNIRKTRLAGEAFVHNSFLITRYALAYFAYMGFCTLLVTGLPAVDNLPPATLTIFSIILFFIGVFVFFYTRIVSKIIKYNVL